MDETVCIIVNGFEERVPRGSTIADIIDMFGEAHKDLVTEMNGRFVYPSAYATTKVPEGTKLEFIHAAFGG